MAERIELGTHLADEAGEVVAVSRTFPGALRRGGRYDLQKIGPVTVLGHARFVHVAQFVGLAGAGNLQRRQNLLRRNVVGRPGLVIRPVHGGPPGSLFPSLREARVCGSVACQRDDRRQWLFPDHFFLPWSIQQRVTDSDASVSRRRFRSWSFGAHGPCDSAIVQRRWRGFVPPVLSNPASDRTAGPKAWSGKEASVEGCS